MTLQFQDYYKILGVSKNAAPKDIKKAYRDLARHYHPDVNEAPEAAEKFKKICEAYEVLKDPEKRKKYDGQGQSWKRTASHDQAGRQHDFRTERPDAFHSQKFSFGTDKWGDSTDGFSDFFRSFFGDEYNERAAAENFWQEPGRTQEAEIIIPLRDAYLGAAKTISLESEERDGFGAVKRVVKNYHVKIPKGIADGSVIRLSGQGERGAGGAQSGDLLLKVKIEPDRRFRLEGRDLHTTLPITPWEAVLGGRIQVQTLDGSVTLAVPRGSQNGSRLRLRGKGMPRLKGGAGDLIVRLEVTVPQRPTREEERLFRELARVSRFSPRAERGQNREAA